jgi:hypothetical protein
MEDQLGNRMVRHEPRIRIPYPRPSQRESRRFEKENQGTRQNKKIDRRKTEGRENVSEIQEERINRHIRVRLLISSRETQKHSFVHKYTTFNSLYNIFSSYTYTHSLKFDLYTTCLLLLRIMMVLMTYNEWISWWHKSMHCENNSI